MNDYGNFWPRKLNGASVDMKRTFLLRGFLLAALLTTPYGFATEVYRWVDEEGHTHYADHPAKGAERFLLARNAQPSYPVKRIYDGDTVLLENGDKIRFLGINTPEIESPRKAGEPGGEEARSWLQAKLSGKSIRLEQDTEARDHYGRMLAHVFTDGGEHINLTLVQNGLAFVDIHPPNVKYVRELLEAENQAEKSRKGLWQRPEYAAQSIASLNAQSPRGWRRLTGHPGRIEDTRTYRKLIFAEGFEANIPKNNLRFFPSLDSYLGKSLEIRGWLYRRGERFAVQLRHPSAIRLLSGQ